jgi:hypothetical protein
MLSVVMLSVVILSAAMLSVVASNEKLPILNMVLTFLKVCPGWGANPGSYDYLFMFNFSHFTT